MIREAIWSWVDVADVAALAAEALRRPERFSQQSWRLGYQAKNMQEVATIIGRIAQK